MIRFPNGFQSTLPVLWQSAEHLHTERLDDREVSEQNKR